MRMTRSDHWRRAQELMEGVDMVGRVNSRQEDLDALALAQVHATLAAADPEVAGEGPVLVGGGDVVVPVAKLEAALAELRTQTPMLSGEYAATFIRERVLGGGER